MVLYWGLTGIEWGYSGIYRLLGAPILFYFFLWVTKSPLSRGPWLTLGYQTTNPNRHLIIGSIPYMSTFLKFCLPQNLVPHAIQWFIMCLLCVCFCGICSSVGSLKLLKSIRICVLTSRTVYVSKESNKQTLNMFNFNQTLFASWLLQCNWGSVRVSKLGKTTRLLVLISPWYPMALLTL